MTTTIFIYASFLVFSAIAQALNALVQSDDPYDRAMVAMAFGLIAAIFLAGIVIIMKMMTG